MQVENQAAKIAIVWGAWGITSWSDVAGFLAALLSFLALAEWVWKRALRPILQHFGYVKYRAPRRREDDDDDPK